MAGLDPAIHALASLRPKTWMPGSVERNGVGACSGEATVPRCSPDMTRRGSISMQATMSRAWAGCISVSVPVLHLPQMGSWFFSRSFIDRRLATHCAWQGLVAFTVRLRGAPRPTRPTSSQRAVRGNLGGSLASIGSGAVRRIFALNAVTMTRASQPCFAELRSAAARLTARIDLEQVEFASWRPT